MSEVPAPKEPCRSCDGIGYKKMGSRNKPLNSVIAMSVVQLVAAEGMSWSDSTSEMFWNVS